MAELNEIMSDKKAGTYKKDFFNVASYIEKFYDAEEYLFNFEANDLVETRSGANDYVEEHTPHVLQHIAPEISWAINKISEATKEKKGMKGAKNGTFHPTWFDSLESASEALERVLIASNNTSIISKIQNWCEDRDIYYNDRRHNRLVIDIVSNTVIGKGIVKGTNYDIPFDCHGLHIVLEYTISKKDGEFAVYDMYPYFTQNDWNIIKKAKNKKS